MVLWIFAVLYLVNFVSFVGAALVTTKGCKDNFLGAIWWCWVMAFAQDAIDLSLEYTKAQHTWFWWWNSKYLLGQSALWTTFGKSKFLWAIFEEFMIDFEQDAIDLSLEHILKHNILDLGGCTWSICSDSNVCGQLLENQIFFGRFSKSSW